MGEKTGLREDLRSEIETLVASDGPDDEVLNEVVRRIHEAHPSWDWSGIYLLAGDVLVLGPRTAPADHSRIGIGEGVCGTAVSEDRNQIVEDVREVENYLACSLHTRSEIVVLIRDDDKIVGEFDIDSDTVGAFTHEDEALLEEMGPLISGRVASLAAREAGCPPRGTLPSACACQHACFAGLSARRLPTSIEPDRRGRRFHVRAGEAGTQKPTARAEGSKRADKRRRSLSVPTRREAPC